MIISFSGNLGSGKSGVAKRLAKELGWPYYGMGKLRRKMAEEIGMTLAEYNKLGETDSSTDLEVDEYQTKLGKTQDNFIIDGRTSWYFIPHSIKIFLKVKLEIGAERIFKDLKDRNEDTNLKTIDDVVKSMQDRVASDTIRYKKYFDINVYNESHYDFVLDTTDLTEEDVFAKVWAYINQLI